LARTKRGTAFYSLHHVIDLEWMLEAYRLTRKDGAPGIDGVTAADYEANGSPISSLKPVAGSKSLVTQSGTAIELLARLCPPGSVDRHSRPSDVFPLTLAKRLCGTVDRFNPAGTH
jgi:hypothetical protein